MLDASNTSTTAICAGPVVLGVVMPMPPTPVQKPALLPAGPRAGFALLKALAAVLSDLEAILPEGHGHGDGLSFFLPFALPLLLLPASGSVLWPWR